MSALDSFNLGDFLRIKEDDENRRRVDSLAGTTLNDILLAEKRLAAAAAQTQINRTLLDVIRVPEPNSGQSGPGSQFGSHHHHQQQHQKEKKTWRAFKERLRLKRAGAAARTAVVRRNSGRFASTSVLHRDDPDVGSSRRLSAALNDERELSAREHAAAAVVAAAAEEEQPVRMSLMDLLEETDRQVVGAAETMFEEVVIGDVTAEEEEVAVGELAAEQRCCVCMVRHRGAAFIPCGHTFCRMCSREVFVHRGNCPLCNTHILEILDIF